MHTEFAWRMLEEIDCGFMLVSPACILQHANHLARLELSRCRFLRIQDGRLYGATPAQTEEITQGVRSAASGSRQMLTLRRGDDMLPVACAPVFQPFEGGPASVLLMLAPHSH